ncbi:MAG: DUF4351 domain-containing protein [Acaryochloris sp. RU_4_1]|nr:DUF4351 domain-containing protein [Acaryochloris sp. RU_4_1]
MAVETQIYLKYTKTGIKNQSVSRPFTNKHLPTTAPAPSSRPSRPTNLYLSVSERESQIQSPSLDQLETLGEALLDFSEPADLVNWLHDHRGK